MIAQFIAQSIFNRMPPTYSFKLNFDRYMEQKSNILYVNKTTVERETFDEDEVTNVTPHMVLNDVAGKKYTAEIAYFRYQDGSTIHLFNKSTYYTAPCVVCSDIQKCTCTIEGLTL